jgi:hypothetical protein
VAGDFLLHFARASLESEPDSRLSCAGEAVEIWICRPIPACNNFFLGMFEVEFRRNNRSHDQASSNNAFINLQIYR